MGLAPINCARVAEIYQSLLAVPSRAKCFFEDLAAEPQTAIAPGPATPQPEAGHCRGEPCHRLATQHQGTTWSAQPAEAEQAGPTRTRS